MKYFVFVHQIAVAADDDTAQFEEELAEKLPRGRAVPLRNIF